MRERVQFFLLASIALRSQIGLGGGEAEAQVYDCTF
jgi:hypothetical protein